MESLQRSGYLCNPQQAYTLRKVTVTEGRARGAAVIEVCTAAGLQVDILPDAGLDIGQVRFKGINMTFISKNGFDNPSLVGVYENEFMNYFPGGLLYTGGLRSVGGANRDQGELHPLHGRFHSLLADQVSTTVEDNTITVSGILRETALFGHALEVKRTIRIPVFGTDITVTDTLTNLTHRDEEYCLLYHCNFGYPLLSADAHVELPEQRRTTPRTPFAAGFLGKECTVSAPVPNEEERCFFHEDMERTASLINPALGVNMTMHWSESLPILLQWRSMASGDYALGLEPTNCYLLGRGAERENGTLPVLKPFGSVTAQVNFSFRTI